MSFAAESLLFPRDEDKPLATILPRDYQIVAHDKAFEIWDSGIVGALNRLATGLGKTILACLQIRTWLNRGENYRAMVISYENQLVWQFAAEIEEVLGISPGIEQAGESVHHQRIPRIVVASRQTLAPQTPAEQKQLDHLSAFGITDVGALTKIAAKSLIRGMGKGIDPQEAVEWLQEFNSRPEVCNGVYSRVHKFDPLKYNWLIIPDEAHRHAYFLHQVRYWVDWFDRNPNSRRSGLTATPKRSDNVSIGDKMFPGIAIDYPLTKAVAEGYAVPYVQRYVSVEGVDFAQIKRVAGDFDDAELERVLGQEMQLAKLVEPLLDMVSDRSTIIFSPGVQMAKDVATYINARSETKCPSCDKVRWYGNTIIGDSALCPCGQPITAEHVTKKPDQAKELDGAIPPKERRAVFEAHQAGQFQFLSVCSLCREGYNDPNVSCVAVFRPVTKKAASLAEQMKGRGCRPLRGVINGLSSKEERLAAIAASSKPNTLIVDLVGISSLSDCASTIQIYSEGEPDEVVERAEQILADEAADEEVNVAETIERAKREIAEERERIKREREEAAARAKSEYERRAAAEARATYTTHEVGTGHEIKGGASERQLNYIGFLGMHIENVTLTTRQAGRIIDQLQNGKDPEQVAHENALEKDQWSYKAPTGKQQYALRRSGVRDVKSPYEASILLDAIKNTQGFISKKLGEIKGASDEKLLNRVGRDLKVASQKLPAHEVTALRAVWTKRREELRHGGDDF